MNESFFVKNKRVATELTEAQSYAVNYGTDLQLVRFRYKTDEKTIELPLTAVFLKMNYSRVRNYLDHCIRHFLARNK